MALLLAYTYVYGSFACLIGLFCDTLHELEVHHRYCTYVYGSFTYVYGSFACLFCDTHHEAEVYRIAGDWCIWLRFCIHTCMVHLYMCMAL